MDVDRQRLLLAYAIATYDTSVRSMEALREAGVVVPYSLTGQARRNLTGFAHEWEALHGVHLWQDESLDRVIAEAREFCTIHQREIDELANQE